VGGNVKPLAYQRRSALDKFCAELVWKSRYSLCERDEIAMFAERTATIRAAEKAEQDDATPPAHFLVRKISL
jgi:hypothetical protein